MTSSRRVPRGRAAEAKGLALCCSGDGREGPGLWGSAVWTSAKSVSFDVTDRLRARADAILQVRTEMARYGVTLGDLSDTGCFRQLAPKEHSNIVRYRIGKGMTWDGIGERPDWLQRDVNGGQDPEHFRV
ncbi:H-NS family nucleoid-associated regulatory protein [Cupriavidus necator]